MAEKIWNVAAYARLSREDGDKEESNSIGSQKEMIREFVTNHPDMVIVHEYVDVDSPVSALNGRDSKT